MNDADNFEEIMAFGAQYYRDSVLYLTQMISQGGRMVGQSKLDPDELRQILTQMPTDYFADRAEQNPEAALREAKMLEGT